MTNFFKKAITFVAAVCIVASTALIGACRNGEGGDGENNNGGHTDPTKRGYEITVLYPDGSPVKGTDAPSKKDSVGVQLVDSEGKDIKNAYSDLSDNGKATINYRVSGEFLIDIINAPRGYEYTDKVTTVSGRGDYTLTLSATQVSYTINVKYPDQTPVSGVTAALKKDGATVKSAVTNASGAAVISDINAASYSVELSGVPAGYGYLPATVTANASSVTVELVSLTAIQLTDKMDEAEVAEWDKIANYYDAEGKGGAVIRFDKTADCYGFTTVNIPEGKKVFYEFTAEEDGEYRLLAKGQFYTVDFYGSDLSEVLNTVTSEYYSTNSVEMFPLELKAGEKCYFAYSIPDRDSKIPDDDHELSGTRQFMITKPVPGIKRYDVTTTGVHELSFDVDTVVLTFKTPDSSTPANPKPTDGGVYEITSDTSVFDVKIEYYAFLSDNAQPTDSEDDISEANKNFKYVLTVPPSHAGNTYYFKVIIKSRLDGGDIVYPSQVPVTITRTGNAKDNFSPVEEQHATATQKYDDQSGTFTYLSLDGGHEFKQDGDKWLVTVSGHDYELAVKISQNIRGMSYSYSTIEYMGDNSVSPQPGSSGSSGSGSDNDEENGGLSETRQNSKLSLYTDPSVGEDENNPKLNFTPFIEEYAKLCNSDGVYLVNGEIKNFLEMYNRQNEKDLVYGLELSGEAVEHTYWWLACGYYA